MRYVTHCYIHVLLFMWFIDQLEVFITLQQKLSFAVTKWIVISGQLNRKQLELFSYVTPAETTCTGGTHCSLLLGLYPERWNEHPVHRHRSALSNTSLASPIFYLDLHTWLGNVRDLQFTIWINLQLYVYLYNY